MSGGIPIKTNRACRPLPGDRNMDAMHTLPIILKNIARTFLLAINRHLPSTTDKIWSKASRKSLKSSMTGRSEEHTSELQSLMRISYAVFCLKTKKCTNNVETQTHQYNRQSRDTMFTSDTTKHTNTN